MFACLFCSDVCVLFVNGCIFCVHSYSVSVLFLHCCIFFYPFSFQVIDSSFITWINCTYQHGSTKYPNSQRPHRRNPQVSPALPLFTLSPSSPLPFPLMLIKGTWPNTGTSYLRRVIKIPRRSTRENLFKQGRLNASMMQDGYAGWGCRTQNTVQNADADAETSWTEGLFYIISVDGNIL